LTAAARDAKPQARMSDPPAAPSPATATRAPAPPNPPPPASTRTSRLTARVRALLPWGSLAIGVASMLTMDRGPKRGALIACAAVALWVMLIALQWLVRAAQARASERTPFWLAAAQWSSLLAAQSLSQLALFFAVPFYIKAAASDDVGHALFLVGLCALSLASLWDPLTAWLFTHPLIAPLLPALASFVALNAVLPGLGLSTRTSLWLSAAVAGAGAALTSIASAPGGGRLRVAAIALPAVLLIPLALRLGAARLVPAAPLRLVKIEIGTQRQEHWVADPGARIAGVPERLLCATAIYSPIGVRDRLFHVWTRDGQPRARVELDIRGGRDAGYRTFSRIGPLGRSGAGVYRCSVETLTGQVLGSTSVRVMGR
jgi:hypothetical protein